MNSGLGDPEVPRAPHGVHLLSRLRLTLEMIKIEHTVFALPFAFLGALLAVHGLPRLNQVLWIVMAMVGARSAAMAFNRLVDLPFDSENARTASRALPRNLLSRKFVVLFTVVSSLLLVAAAYMLNPLAFRLSPVALGVVFFYSYTKRFTWWSHVFLGISLACAPIGAWIAVRGSLEITPLLLGLAVLLWVAGFDIIYACQDVEFDRKASLHSIPARFGIAFSLWSSAILHLLMIALLAFLFVREGLGAISQAGLGIVAVFLAYEHSLVKTSDLSKVNTAFFTVNGWISILLLVTTSLDLFWKKTS